MSRGLLDRRGDRPNSGEEEAIARISRDRAAKQREIDDVQFVLERSASRSRRAKARGARGDNDLAIERHVQNRRLDQRNALLGVPAGEKVYADE